MPFTPASQRPPYGLYGYAPLPPPWLRMYLMPPSYYSRVRRGYQPRQVLRRKIPTRPNTRRPVKPDLTKTSKNVKKDNTLLSEEQRGRRLGQPQSPQRQLSPRLNQRPTSLQPPSQRQHSPSSGTRASSAESPRYQRFDLAYRNPKPVKEQQYLSPPRHGQHPTPKPTAPPTINYQVHLTNINKFQSTTQFNTYFQQLPSQQRSQLYQSLSSSWPNQSWSTLSASEQRQAYRRFRKFAPNSVFSNRKSDDFVKFGQAAKTIPAAEDGNGTKLKALSAVVTVSSFIIDQVKTWKEMKEDNELDALEARIKVLEGNVKKQKKDEKLVELKRKLQRLEEEIEVPKPVTMDDVKASLDDEEEDNVEYEDYHDGEYNSQSQPLNYETAYDYDESYANARYLDVHEHGQFDSSHGDSTLAQPSPPQLPQDWTAKFDPRYGQYYYIHIPTRSTQWEFPTSPTPTPTPTPTIVNDLSHTGYAEAMV